MNKEDKKLQKHLVNEMMKVSKTNPDVMIYMQALMKKYDELELENEELKRMCEIYSKSLYNADLKKAENEITRLNNIIDELEKWLNEVSFFAGVKQFEIDIDEVLNKLKELKEGNK